MTESRGATMGDAQLRSMWDDRQTHRERARDLTVSIERRAAALRASGWTNQQIADVVGCTEGAVRQMVSRAQQETPE